jgi:hypothetical protein
MISVERLWNLSTHSPHSTLKKVATQFPLASEF